jgi:hypothetical protein
MKLIPLIRHETWNSLVDKIKRRRPLQFSYITTGLKWEHPWTIKPRWDKESKQWLFNIRPGFVNGVEVTIPARVKHLGERSLKRLEAARKDTKNPEQVVDAFLTEWPLVEIGDTRVIGTGADPVGISGNFNVSYEPLPKFFADLGVTEVHTKTSGNLNSGITFTDEVEDTKKARRLRACDISLWKDRLSAKFEVYPGSLLDGSMGSIFITYNHSGEMKKNPYLRINSKFNPPPVPESEMALLEGMTDPEYDLTKIATIYFVSPEGAEPAAELDETWTPYVEYNHFWNLAHAPQNIPDYTPIEPIRLTTGLAGGLADFTIATLLAPINSEFNRTIQILNSRNLKGSFWTI